MATDKKMIDELMKDHQGPEDIFVKDDIFIELSKAIPELILDIILLTVKSSTESRDFQLDNACDVSTVGRNVA